MRHDWPTSHAARIAAPCCAGMLALLAACGGGRDRAPAPGRSGTVEPSLSNSTACPASAPAPHPLANVSEQQLRVEYWLAQSAAYGGLDEPLMTPDDVAQHNRALAVPIDGRRLGQADLLAPVDTADVLSEVRERLAAVREKAMAGTYVRRDGTRLSVTELEALRDPSQPPTFAPSLRVAVDSIPIRCSPRSEGIFTSPVDPAFDRNNCSMARPQEAIQLLGRWQNGMWLARTGYTVGWIEPGAALSPELPVELAQAWVRGARRVVLAQTRVRTVNGAEVTLPALTIAPLAVQLSGLPDRLRFATRDGFTQGAPAPDARLVDTARPLTRRAVLETAFSLLGSPYGWGDQDGGRDCSRFLLDVFATFGLGLPRNSGRQALAGSFGIDVSGARSIEEKQQVLDAAARRGIVLLHFPGHIMLYLGRDREGVPMALHSFSEYLDPCPGPAGGETLRRVDLVTVSDLSLGRSTSRKSFVERLTRITVLGGSPGLDLEGATDLRAPVPIHSPPNACNDRLDAALFRSPRNPSSTAPLRVIAVATAAPGPSEMVLFSPSGEALRPTAHRLGGPPFGTWVQVDQPAAGRWTVVWGEQGRVIACEQFHVGPRRAASSLPSAYVWEPRWKWEADTENLYAAFTEQLFDYPLEQDLTWHNLQELLADRDHNLLYDHLGLDEEGALSLHPDCADLPYFLRAYFAWKLELPFGFRYCSRGAAGSPPRCGPLQSSVVPREAPDDLGAFRIFMRKLANAVQSASARTHPDDSDTDVYPADLSRATLTPGTVFADPYGHLLVVAKWSPQSVGSYGAMFGADSQPDGTIGRRQFWRGSFLFTPETTDVGAGFKTWRPVLFDSETGTVTSLDNGALDRSREHTPFSVSQYSITAEQFYDRMDVLMNPRPLDPETKLASLVDALEEGVQRRVVSVQNGEDFSANHRDTVIPMPEGYDVFETTGAWEDYATPSRDMRLLISIDAVLAFPGSVERAPERYGLAASDAAAAVARQREQLTRELRERRFRYRRSDGSEWELSLSDTVARAREFELAYNPNDCVERRWGASEGTPEAATCRRNAPAAQRARMLQYRQWFVNRRRPPR